MRTHRRTKRRWVVIMGGLSLLFAGAIKQPSMTAYAAEPGAATTAQAATQSPRWEGAGDIWRVRAEDGNGYLKNTWFRDEVTGDWYLLGAGDGTEMYAGLITDQSTGKSYLLNVNHDGTYGKMCHVDGVYSVNGVQVYLQFNQVSDGSFGAITSGLSELRSANVVSKELASIPVAGTGGTATQTQTEVTQTQDNTQPAQDNTQPSGETGGTSGGSIWDYIDNTGGWEINPDAEGGWLKGE